MLLIYGLYSTCKYFYALKNWSEAKGELTGFKFSAHITFLKIRFTDNNGQKIDVELDPSMPMFTRFAFSEYSDLIILYPRDNPKKALLKTVRAPIGHVICIILGVAAIYFL